MEIHGSHGSQLTRSANTERLLFWQNGYSSIIWAIKEAAALPDVKSGCSTASTLIFVPIL